MQKFAGEEFFGRNFELDFWQDKSDLKHEKQQNQQNQMSQLLISFGELFYQ
jgi:hypothetical protein